jgi:hypothetical protein
LQEELQEQNALYQRALKQKDEGEVNMHIAQESMQKFDTLVKQQVQEAMRKKMNDYQDVKRERDSLKVTNIQL